MVAPLLRRSGSVNRATRGVTMPKERRLAGGSGVPSIEKKNPVGPRYRVGGDSEVISLAGFIMRPQADLKSAPRPTFGRMAMVASVNQGKQAVREPTAALVRSRELNRGLFKPFPRVIRRSAGPAAGAAVRGRSLAAYVT